MPGSCAIPLFVALAPDAETTARVQAYKDQIREAVGPQRYVDHPPHMTLYLAAFAELADVLTRTQQIARSSMAPRVEIAGWHTFFSDPLTGNNTLTISFDQSAIDSLQRLQRAVVDSLVPCRDVQATQQRLQERLKYLSPAEQRDALHYGFPYVGGGWHPHLTIGSICPARWQTVADLLLDHPPRGDAGFPRLQVYRLVDDTPQLIESFELQNGKQQPLGSRNDEDGLKQNIVSAVWKTVDRTAWIRSATITGSFLTCPTLDAISDIDLVVVVDHLNADRFDALQQQFADELEPILIRDGLALRINSTLGPRKIDAPATAVLHLMVYTSESHRQHAVRSPFTCLDWQRSSSFRKRSLESIYPVFALQPHHFLDSRRSPRDYLRDFDRNVLSFREVVCTDAACEEIVREQRMNDRDRNEYAYHVQRFLMRNLLKLLERNKTPPGDETLAERFLSVFPRGAQAHTHLFRELRQRKAARHLAEPVHQLDSRLRHFVADFEAQFRSIFHESATRHIVFRHAPTLLGGAAGDQRRFVGRTDPDIDSPDNKRVSALVALANASDVSSAFCSPLRRCRQTLNHVTSQLDGCSSTVDARLIEIDYGKCEQMSVAEARRDFPGLFAAWTRGEDPRFPGGENTADVAARVGDFARETWDHASQNTLVCTHNVVIRAIVGEAFAIPERDWHKIRVPHLAHVTLIQTRDFGRFLDLDESVELQLFEEFFASSDSAQEQRRRAA